MEPSEAFELPEVTPPPEEPGATARQRRLLREPARSRATEVTDLLSRREGACDFPYHSRSAHRSIVTGFHRGPLLVDLDEQRNMRECRTSERCLGAASCAEAVELDHGLEVHEGDVAVAVGRDVVAVLVHPANADRAGGHDRVPVMVVVEPEPHGDPAADDLTRTLHGRER